MCRSCRTLIAALGVAGPAIIHGLIWELLAGCWGLGVASESYGVHRSFPGTGGLMEHMAGHASTYTQVCVCILVRFQLCVPGGYLKRAVRLSLAPLQGAAFACLSWDHGPCQYMPARRPLSLPLRRKEKPGYPSPGAHTPPSALPAKSGNLLLREPSRFWTLGELQDKMCPKSHSSCVDEGGLAFYKMGGQAGGGNPRGRSCAVV